MRSRIGFVFFFLFIINCWSDLSDARRQGIEEFLALQEKQTPGRSTFAYAEPYLTHARGNAMAFWKYALSVELEEDALFLPGFSWKSAVIDAVLGLTEPGEIFAIIGDLEPLGIKRGSFLSRQVIFPQPRNDQLFFLPMNQVNLVILDETSMTEKTWQEELSARQLPLEIPVLILRQYKSNQDYSYLDSAHQNIMESIHFPIGYSLTTGAKQLLHRLIHATETRGQWLGRLDQFILRTSLKQILDPLMSQQSHSASKAPRVFFSTPSEKTETKNRDLVVVSDFLELFPGFNNANPKNIFQLALGQPGIDLSTSFLKKIAPSILDTPCSEAHRMALSSIQSWYCNQYQVALQSNEVTFHQGASGAIFDLFASLPRDSVIYLPKMSYFVYHHIAIQLGLQLKVLPLNSLDIACWHPENLPDVLVVSFPHNPTGEMLHQATRKRLHELAQAGTLVVNDLSFPKFYYKDRPVESILTDANDFTNLVEIFSSSKDLGLPELRLAGMVGDAKILKRLNRNEIDWERDTSSVRLALFANALTHPECYLTTQDEMSKRRDCVIQAFRTSGWPDDMIGDPAAGLNVLLRLPCGVSSIDFARALWLRSSVMVMPGDFFLDSQSKGSFVRLSLSENAERLRELSQALRTAGLQFDQLPAWIEATEIQEVSQEVPK